MIQKSIYQKLGDSWRMNSLPESGANVDVRVYIENDEATVLLDTSGEALHKRGYRTDGGEAPLRETTAAVILQEMTWRRKIPLHDAFCGSGTIAIEACLYAHNIAPGLGRNFAYENFSFYDAKKSLEIKKEEAAKIRTDVECRITGSDISAEAVQRSRLNAEHACVAAGRALQLIGSDLRIERPDFTQADFSELRAPYENGLLLGNPPYGERLGDTELARELYKKMQSLREDFPLWQMGFITSQKSFEEFFGKKADSVRPLKAGNLDTALYIYR
jgi:putative N6-adenine-specific DNA methylase